MKEMVAGCCVCSDERGWTENPLVYCDGAGCNIAVHQACYGILSVPSGNWYCRKCESLERSARLRCELCPSKDGALKRTDNAGWAHVVCGLYIPEVRFASVTTMEPIVLSQIPSERFNKVCYICEQNNRGSRASVGACMQCNKAGCKQQFHVTCAQALGLLCEEAGNYLDNVKYCGYCQEHYMKLKKGTNIKTIPPYRPISSNNSGSEESPDKKVTVYNQNASDMKQPTKRKSISNKPANQNGPVKITTMADKKEVHRPGPNLYHLNGSVNLSTSTSNPQSSKPDNSPRFTTSNFVESVITPSESVFADVQKNKKRKPNEQSSPMNNINVNEQERASVLTTTNAEEEEEDDDDDDGDSILKFVEEPNLSTLKNDNTTKTSTSNFNISNGNTNTITVISSSVASISASNPFANTTTVISSPITSVSAANPFTKLPTSVQSCSFATPVPTSSFISTSVQSSKFINAPVQSSKFINAPVQSSKFINAPVPSSSFVTPVPTSSFVTPVPTSSFVTPVPTSSFVAPVPTSSFATPVPTSSFATPVPTSSFATPVPTSSFVNPPVSSYLSTNAFTETKGKSNSSFQSGISAPHMLGNQLNPTSSMAQKMSDTLNDELEAHSIFTAADSNANTNTFVGPPLYNKVLSSTRASESSKRSNSPSNGPLASLSSSAANFPQTLEELLETQWEQGGTFLMEQAQHFDIASLLTCLHKLKEENLGLEEHIRKLKARRDHLLGVNARLAMPLAPISQRTTKKIPPSKNIYEN